MKFSTIALVVPFFTLAVSVDVSLRAVRKAFFAADIPADLTIKFDPSVLLEVTFPEPGPPITLTAGVQLPRNATVGPPSFSLVGKAAGNGPFVVAMVDPDAPTPQTPTEAQIRHFLGSDFHANALGQLKNNTPAISDFLQPTPPAGSDAHRYVFLVFKQPADFDRQTLVNSSTSIELFNISTFAAATRLGSPFAGTFMRVAPDPS
ncbi:PEBP-like protein [Mycena floridula]|nr:PEBP-like protein [Mycena floridula]